ncbi:hypothetical protein GCM10007989_27950 [Devosia pacifica]|uniref:Lipoprotein n=1 Tax=Devosia pacifica TaxID=1335967 RepID=A0A918VW51_9HYPH|nr:hypothetical protein [Devosia pacifica]GHA30533.1 hypothetical protein GCM10007989_27950 [Devosia pacifica]
MHPTTIFTWPRIARGLSAVAVASALAGCSMGSMFGGGNSTADANLANATPSQQQIAAAQANALPAIATECPPIKVRQGGEAMFRYSGNNVGVASQLQYQGVIDEVSRNCVASNGQIQVTMGASGRILLGPQGSQSQVTAPVRFAVERNGQAVFTEKYDIPVSVAGNSGEFLKVVENVNIPYLGGESITIWVGFDTRG